MSSCPICFESLLEGNTASPDVCDHVFCLTCLTKWSKHESFCPVDRKRFKKIINLGSDTVVQIKRKRKKKTKILYDISAHCEICTSDAKEDTLLLCDCCDLGYHCECLTPPLSSVPSGRWCCPMCVFVESKLKEKKGDVKGAKSVSSKKISRKRRRSKPGHSSVFSKRSSSSVSTLSASDIPHSDVETSQKRSRSCSRQDREKNKYLDSEKINSNDSDSCSQPQDNDEIFVSEQDLKMLCCDGKGSYICPGIVISPKKVRPQSSKESNESNTDSVKEKPPQFSVFEKIDNTLASKQKYMNTNSNFNEAVADIPIGLNCDLKKVHIPKCHEGKEVSEECNVMHPSMDKTRNGNFNHQALSDASCEAASVSPVDHLIYPGSSNAKDHHPNQEIDQLELNVNNCDTETNSTHKLTAFSVHKTNSNQNTHQLTEMNYFEIERIPLPNLEYVSNCKTKDDHSSVHPDLTETKIGHSDSVPNTLPDLNKQLDSIDVIEESTLLVNPLLDFESRISQYALNAKVNLQKELQKIEQEKWKYWNPPKRLRHRLSFSQKPSKNLLDIPMKSEVERNKIYDFTSCRRNIFNIAEYTERVKRGAWQPENIVIVERHKDNAFINHCPESQIEKQLPSGCSLNVFQLPNSQKDFTADNKCTFSVNSSECKNGIESPNYNELQRNLLEDNKSKVYMTSFNPKNHSDSSNCKRLQRKLLQAAFQVDCEELAMRSDGSLYLNWAKSN